MSESPLDEGLVDPDPIVEVRRWLEAALAAGIPNADAMVVATAVFSILLVALSSRGLRRVAPGTLVPAAFAVSAALSVLVALTFPHVLSVHAFDRWAAEQVCEGP